MLRVRPTSLRALSACVAVAGFSASAFGYLGSFRPQDGYSLSVYSGSYNWCDVSYYNSGQHGPNAGGGPGPTLWAPNNGNWKTTGQAGGFFATAAARTAAIGTAPPYPPTAQPGMAAAYMVGNHFPGRGNDGSNLAFRNDTPQGTGDATYDYSIDTYDTGGPVPSSVISGTVSTQFYLMPDPGSTPGSGAPARDKFVLSLKDSSNSTGFEWGYADDNEVYWRQGSSGAWNYTGVYANAGNWDGVKLSIDLTGQTFGIDYYDVSSNTWSVMVPSGTALGAPMQNLTTLGWRLADAVSLGVGGKNFFDDFSFNIPEPTTALLLGVGGLALLARRR
ncbi:MAG: PEP-CTERM sorting domain-containing protein [Phycisphaerae bacterium]